MLCIAGGVARAWMVPLFHPSIAEAPVRFRALVVLAALLTLVGCAAPPARVTGRVTCDGKPVVGGILFSPKGEGHGNTGPAVSAPLKKDGSYELRLATIGKHSVVVTPRDVKVPVKPGELDYPCDRSPSEWDVKAGDNEIVIELTKRMP